jgi:hypothetical protein
MVTIRDFMSVRERGSVQHLGSKLISELEGDADCWSAFNTIFPSITATGIPKNAALEAVERLESRPRELYSGAVLKLGKENWGSSFEAALVLRSVFQDKNRSWIQAGAGIIEQSNPEREMTETMEKLASIAPYLIAVDVETPVIAADLANPATAVDVENTPIAAGVEAPTIAADMETLTIAAHIETPTIAADIETPEIATDIETTASD